MSAVAVSGGGIGAGQKTIGEKRQTLLRHRRTFGIAHYCNTAVRGEKMEINIVFRIAAVGILVAVLMLTTLAGLVVVLFWVIQYISQLFDTVQTLFQL